jgi:SAM-dependent methyltransferase
LVFQTSPLLAPEKERAHYDLHENGPSTGYLAFLQPALDAVLSRAAPAGEGLDFGCGPGPVLAQQLRERGYETVLYDPFYAPDEGVLRRTYDFITCTETAEHFADPAREFEQLASLLRPGGLLVAKIPRTSVFTLKRLSLGWPPGTRGRWSGPRRTWRFFASAEQGTGSL